MAEAFDDGLVELTDEEQATFEKFEPNEIIRDALVALCNGAACVSLADELTNLEDSVLKIMRDEVRMILDTYAHRWVGQCPKGE